MFFHILQLTGVIFCIFTSFLIWFRFNKNNSLSGILLGAMLFLIGLCHSFYLLIIYGIINHFPYLYKVPAPINFLIFPLAYLYIRAVLYKEYKLRLLDALHLIPFLFIAINYLPFYMMNLTDKAEYVYEITQNFELSYNGQDGLFPEWVNILLRSISSIVYLIFQWHLIISFFRKHASSNSRQFNLVKKWVFHLTTIQTVYSIALLLLYLNSALVALAVISSLGNYAYIVSILVNGSFLLIACYLLWNPHLLVGLPKLNLNKEKTRNILPLKNIHFMVQEQKTFLSPELTVHKLAKLIGVRSRKISDSIGHSNFENFNDFINHFRIAYAVDKINDGYLKKYSVDALSETSGFNSKNAFYQAFKKAHGCTPLKYNKAS